jgi:hypothetical protein
LYYNTLLRKTKKDINKWEDIPCSWIGDIILLSAGPTQSEL